MLQFKLIDDESGLTMTEDYSYGCLVALARELVLSRTYTITDHGRPMFQIKAGKAYWVQASPTNEVQSIRGDVKIDGVVVHAA